MKIEISVGSKHLVLTPETEFEKEMMRKYFQEEKVEATCNNDGTLWIKWSGPAGT